MTRGQVGRELARVELTVAVAVVVGTAFAFVAAPGHPGGGPPEWATETSLIVALLGLIVGFAWMIRIYRADLEPDANIWRYRD